MSPEQARGDAAAIDVQTDVYGLGAILFEILTGQPPVDGNRVSKVVRNARRGALTSPSKLKSGVPKPLESICMRALSTDKSQRYANAGKMAGDLEQYLAGESVTAHRESLIERAYRLTSKYRGVALAAGLALLTVALVSFSSAMWVNNSKKAVVASAAETVEQKNLALAQKDAAERATTKYKAAGKRLNWLLRKSNGLIGALAKENPSHALEILSEEVDAVANEENPRNKAAILTLVATNYYALGEYEKSVPPAKEVYSIWKEIGNGESMVSLKAKEIWAHNLYKSGDHATALEMYEEIVPGINTEAGALLPDVMLTRFNYGVCLLGNGKAEEAIGVLEDTSNQLDQASKYSLRALKCRRELGEACIADGNITRAIEVLEDLSLIHI